MDTSIEKGLAWVQDAAEKGFSYVKWDGSGPARECPICHNHDRGGAYYGGNCIWFASAYLFHGMKFTDVSCACDGLLGGSSAYTALLYMTYGFAQKLIDKRLGPGRFGLIRKKDRSALQSGDLKRGDIIIYYNHGFFWHVAIYTGEGRITDCAAEPGGVSERNWELGYPCRAALRYIG